MKIVMLEPVGTGIPPLGLLFLSACLKKNGFPDITLCSINSNSKSYERTEKYFFEQLEHKPLVLITATIPVWKEASDYAKIAKDAGCSVIVGGPGPTIFGRRILEKFPFIDAVTCGEGEENITEIAKSAPKNDFTGINGVIWRKNGEIIENERSGLIKDLDAIPFPDYSILDFKSYHGAFSILTSRGCPYNCEFCFKPVHGNTFRAMSPKRVVEEMKWIIETFPEQFEKANRTFTLADDIFNFDLDRAKKIAHLIIEQNLNVKLVSINGFHVRTVDQELFDLLKKAGLVEVWFGVDAGSESILKTVGKGITLDMVRNAVNYAKKAGIRTVGAHFIIGLTGETLKTAREGIAFAKSLPLDEVGFNHANILPGTRLWTYATTHGEVLHKTDGFDFTSFKQLNSGVIFQTPEFSKEDREIAFEEATKVVNYIKRKHLRNPKRIINFLKEINSVEDLFWAFDRAKTFIFSKNLRNVKRKEKPSALKKDLGGKA